MTARALHNRRLSGQRKREVTRHEQVARVIVLSMLVVSLLGLLFWEVHQWLMNPRTLPVEVVKIEGDLQRLEIAELEQAVAGQVSGGYFNIDLNAVKQAAHGLAWVEGVSIKRRWPDTLVMNITERTPLARWGNRQLVTASGVVFEPETNLPEGLPLLTAGSEHSAEQVVAFYQREQTRFLALGLVLTGVELNDRGGWSMQFANGLKVSIGRSDISLRLQRLEKYLAAIQAYRGMPVSIDLRYEHGMAVNFGKQPDPQETGDQAEKEAV